jgi:hypothetical protein
MIKENKDDRVGIETLNNQGCLMKIIEYNNSMNIIVKFQDEYKAKVKSQYSHFVSGEIRNPYYKSVFGIGMIGSKYPKSINNKITKEYNTWSGMLRRCFDAEHKENHPTYKDAICCDEWLLYENFYEWLHRQENFDKWILLDKSAIDKDILIKGNKIYSPDTCCLVPLVVNNLFIKSDASRGDLPIGVVKKRNGFLSRCCNPITNQRDCLGTYTTPNDAFLAYKTHKECLIKKVAQIEYDNGNINNQCYNAMMNYEVEITD